jgi:exosome complex RNA-binding protein Rrp42 (RNase PH superfamily)
VSYYLPSFSFSCLSLTLAFVNSWLVVPNVDLPAMCHPKFKPGPPSDEAQVLSERLFETLTS